MLIQLNLLNLLKLLPDNERLPLYRTIQNKLSSNLFDRVGLLKILPAQDMNAVFSESISFITSELQKIGNAGTLEVLIDMLPLPLVKQLLDSLRTAQCDFIH
jgi:hypothetical protein